MSFCYNKDEPSARRRSPGMRALTSQLTVGWHPDPERCLCARREHSRTREGRVKYGSKEFRIEKVREITGKGERFSRPAENQWRARSEGGSSAGGRCDARCGNTDVRLLREKNKGVLPVIRNNPLFSQYFGCRPEPGPRGGSGGEGKHQTACSPAPKSSRSYPNQNLPMDFPSDGRPVAPPSSAEPADLRPLARSPEYGLDPRALPFLPLRHHSPT